MNRNVITFVIATFIALQVGGCGTQENEVSESTNDIQAYLNENPGAVEQEEDRVGSEEDIFDESMNGDLSE